MLRPLLHTSKLDIWSFYRTESLAHGPSYDVELTESELRLDEDNDEMMMNDGLITSSADNSQRRTVMNGCYDNIELMQPASCSFILSVSFNFLVFRCITNVAHTHTQTPFYLIYHRLCFSLMTQNFSGRMPFPVINKNCVSTQNF